MRTLKVQGKGRLQAQPDLAILSFDVEAKHRDYGNCVNLLNRQVEGLRQNIEATKLSRAELKTSNFNIQENWEYLEKHRVFTGYMASHSLNIELAMEKELLNQALKCVAQGQSNAAVKFFFSVKDKDALRKRAMALAVEDAKSNAAVLASSAGIRLGNIQYIEYGWAEVRFRNDEGKMFVNSRDSLAESSLDIEPSALETEEHVTLVFALED